MAIEQIREDKNKNDNSTVFFAFFVNSLFSVYAATIRVLRAKVG